MPKKGLQAQLDRENEKKNPGSIDITNPAPKKKRATTAKKDEPKTVSEELIRELMEKIEQQNSKIEALEKRNTPAPAAATAPAQTSETKIVQDDYMEEPAVFFAFSIYFSIASYSLRGQEVKPPLRKIIPFEPAYRYVSKVSGKQRGSSEVISVSQVTIRSKKEYEFLINSPDFKIKFFENMKEVTTADAFFAEKVSQANNVVSQWNDHQVITRAQAENIPINSGDMKVLRKKLVDKMAKDALSQDKKRNLALAERTIEEKTTIDDKALATAHANK